MPLAWIPKINRLWSQIGEEEEKVEELEKPPWQPPEEGWASLMMRDPLESPLWGRIAPPLPEERPPLPPTPSPEPPVEPEPQPLSLLNRIFRFSPYTMSGSSAYQSEKEWEAVSPEAKAAVKELYELYPTGIELDYKEAEAKLLEKYPELVARARLAPSPEEYREYRALPWLQQMKYEMPAMAIAGTLFFPAIGSIPIKGVPISVWEARAMSWALRKAFQRVAAFKEWRNLRQLKQAWEQDSFYQKYGGGIKAYSPELEKDLFATYRIFAQKTPESQRAAEGALRTIMANFRGGRYGAVPTRPPEVPIRGFIPAWAGGLPADQRALLPMTAEKWAIMNVPAKVTLVKSLNMAGTVGSKTWGALSEVEQATLLGQGRLPPEPAIEPVAAPPPVVEPLVAEGQVTTIRNIARDKLMLDPVTDVPTRNFNRLAKIMTGKKDVNKMTVEEADAFIQALNSLVPRKGLPPRLPTRTTIITEAFAEKIPHLKEIGALERIRPARQVFQKIGLRKEIWEPAFEAELLQDEAFRAFDAAISPFERAIRPYEAREAIFSVLEGELDIATLNPIEKKAHNWLKAKYDKWADKLKLPQEQRRKNYVTHIFEKGVTEYLAETNKLDPDLIAALDYITPKTIFNPYLQKRLGQEVGLIRDPFKAARAYERKALKVEYYGPLVTKIRAFLPYLSPTARGYLKNYITRITGRPLAIDRELNTTLAEFGKKIAKLPGGKKLGEFLQTRNPSGILVQQYVNLLYTMWLGLKPTSAIRNASQPFLSLCEVGPMAFAKALKLWGTAEGREVMKHNKVVRSRVQAPLPGVDSAFTDRWIGKVRKAAMYMFRGVDRKWNVPISYLSGYAEARRLGLPKEWAYKRGNEVAADTQYIYTKLGSASWGQSNIGRLLSPLTTWPENWMELITRWIRGRPSYVFREYEEATGKTLPLPESWIKKRKSGLLYLAIVVSAYAAEQNTGVRWREYTGWTSIKYIANIIGGRLPGLDLPHAVGQLTIGALMNDNRMMMAGWNRLKPWKAFGIARQLEGILSGDKDWLTLFLYMTAGKKHKGGLPERILPERPQPTLPKRILP